jgi:cytoskeletal protein CcmA (bactofilin family)
MSFGGFKDKKPSDSSTPSVGGGSPSFSGGGISGGGDSARSEAYLGRGAAVVGTLSFSGPVEIDCAVEGEIHAQGSLTLGEGANIQGKVYGAEVTVRGTVNGDLIAAKRLTIKKPARIVGNISCPVISIEEGVHFEGRCSMVAAVVSQPSATDSSRSKIIGAIG